MNNDRDANQPSLEVILHAALGVVMAVSLAVMLVAPHVHIVVM